LELKLQHWRAFPGIFACEGALVLAFGLFVCCGDACLGCLASVGEINLNPCVCLFPYCKLLVSERESENSLATNLATNSRQRIVDRLRIGLYDERALFIAAICPSALTDNSPAISAAVIFPAFLQHATVTRTAYECLINLFAF